MVVRCPVCQNEYQILSLTFPEPCPICAFKAIQDEKLGKTNCPNYPASCDGSCDKCKQTEKK